MNLAPILSGATTPPLRRTLESSRSKENQGQQLTAR